jgi:hypothetical protein
VGPKLNIGTSSTSHPANQAHHHDGAGPNHTASRRSLTIALTLTFGYMLAEVIGCMAAHSLALIADAGHRVANSVAIGLALLAMWILARPVSITRTFGFQRTEILAVGVGGLVINLAVAWTLHRSAKESLNVEGAPAPYGRPVRLDNGSNRQRVDRRLWLVHSRLNLQRHHRGANSAELSAAALEGVSRADGGHANARRLAPLMLTPRTRGGYYRRA